MLNVSGVFKTTGLIPWGYIIIIIWISFILQLSISFKHGQSSAIFFISAQRWRTAGDPNAKSINLTIILEGLLPTMGP